MHLMDREIASDPFPPSPTPEEFQEFLDKVPNVGPSKDNFAANLAGTPKDSWNQLVTTLFVKDFLSVNWYDCIKDKISVTNAFVTVLTGLIKAYRRHQREAGSNIAKALRFSKAARARRKLQV
jgi:hypothetical protein